MKIIFIIVGTLAVFAAYVAYIVIDQKRGDNRFVDRLRGQADTIILKNIRLVHERIGKGHHDYHYSTQQECRELLVGSAFLMLPGGTPTALYNVALSPKGVSGITWSIPIEHPKVLDQDSIQIECCLPNDDYGFSRITFEGILSDSNRAEILRRLGL
jgi:hypothetical protein